MICPDCQTENIPGADECESCGQDLRNLDLPGVKDVFTYHLLHDQLGDVAKETTTVAPGEPVALAVHHMQPQETGCVLVMEDEQLVGIITERDILLKAAGENVDLNAVAVRELMTQDPVILREEDTLAVALHKMSIGGFRHIPLVTKGHVTGIVSVRDLLHHVADFIQEQPSSAP
ncbi:MAG: CBS domain-containing protein [Chloroflexi bacterium]|nr:CBS domain-containing protein [Chloroflexota bacterium]